MINGQSKKGPIHPFAKEDPKPTRARLVSLLDPLGRRRYGEVERFLATMTGTSSGLHYYHKEWGWAVRYMLGPKDALCTLHLLPNIFEATVALAKEVDTPSIETLPPDLRRRVTRVQPLNGVRMVRLPLKSDVDYQNFQGLIQFKVNFIRAKRAGKKSKVKNAAIAS